MNRNRKTLMIVVVFGAIYLLCLYSGITGKIDFLQRTTLTGPLASATEYWFLISVLDIMFIFYMIRKNYPSINEGRVTSFFMFLFIVSSVITLLSTLKKYM